MANKIIAVDFDGTLCEDRWPLIGAPNKELLEYLITQQQLGDKIILWTCRVNTELYNAVRWCAEQGLVFDKVNANIDEHVLKYGCDTRKIYADIYIDDRADTSFKIPFIG